MGERVSCHRARFMSPTFFVAYAVTLRACNRAAPCPPEANVSLRVFTFRFVLAHHVPMVWSHGTSERQARDTSFAKWPPPFSGSFLRSTSALCSVLAPRSPMPWTPRAGLTRDLGPIFHARLACGELGICTAAF